MVMAEMEDMKITNADLAFSWCVRERADWTCERCGAKYTPPTKTLQCSHYFSRDNKAVRVYIYNAFAHCHGCHSHLGGNPHVFRDWTLEKLGQEKYDELVSASQQNAIFGKLWKREQKEIAKFYWNEYNLMRALREAGARGRIEFTNYFEEQ